MDTAEYQEVVLGLIFLKYISDAFEAKQAELDAQHAQGADPEDRDKYRAVNIFWVPPEARWAYLNPSRRSLPSVGDTFRYCASCQITEGAWIEAVLGDREAVRNAPADGAAVHA